MIKSIIRKLTQKRKSFNILGIETSCDDTSVAIINSEKQILNIVTESQYAIHEPYGGIKPCVAAFHHSSNLPSCVKKCFDDIDFGMDDIDLISATRGPGLSSSLYVGFNSAKVLAAANNKKFIGVHHMEAHALTIRLTSTDPVEFPYLCLLISGGHTLLVIVKGVNEYEELATTADESIGEAYDKIARKLGISWSKEEPLDPGKKKIGGTGGAGPALEKIALNGDPNAYTFTLPMYNSNTAKTMAFSFCGLRTQVGREIEKIMLRDGSLNDQIVADIAASFQATAIKHLDQKLELCMKYCTANKIRLKSIVASGGVASNLAIRTRLLNIASYYNIHFLSPPPSYCTDNAAMIAWTAVERANLGLFDDLSGDIITKWPLNSLYEMYKTKLHTNDH